MNLAAQRKDLENDSRISKGCQGKDREIYRGQNNFCMKRLWAFKKKSASYEIKIIHSNILIASNNKL